MVLKFDAKCMAMHTEYSGLHPSSTVLEINFYTADVIHNSKAAKLGTARGLRFRQIPSRKSGKREIPFRKPIGLKNCSQKRTAPPSHAREVGKSEKRVALERQVRKGHARDDARRSHATENRKDCDRNTGTNEDVVGSADRVALVCIVP